MIIYCFIEFAIRETKVDDIVSEKVICIILLMMFFGSFTPALAVGIIKKQRTIIIIIVVSIIHSIFDSKHIKPIT